MAESIREVMTDNPICLDAKTTVTRAAKLMRDKNIGDVLIEKDGKLFGIVTDRDLVLRVMAEGRDPNVATLGDVCTEKLVTVSIRDDIDKAIKLMRDKAIRRLPVVEDGKPVGILSLGDLAVDRDPHSVLGEISKQPPNSEAKRQGQQGRAR